jgi:hypothetical protein
VASGKKTVTIGEDLITSGSSDEFAEMRQSAQGVNPPTLRCRRCDENYDNFVEHFAKCRFRCSDLQKKKISTQIAPDSVERHQTPPGKKDYFCGWNIGRLKSGKT